MYCYCLLVSDWRPPSHFFVYVWTVFFPICGSSTWSSCQPFDTVLLAHRFGNSLVSYNVHKLSWWCKGVMIVDCSTTSCSFSSVIMKNPLRTEIRGLFDHPHDIHADWIYSRTGYDVSTYFRSTFIELQKRQIRWLCVEFVKNGLSGDQDMLRAYRDNRPFARNGLVARCTSLLLLPWLKI